jgi:hypothetical protein
MESWEVMFTTLYSAPLAYVLINSIRQGKQINTIMNKIDYLVSSQDKMGASFAIFVKTEIDELKNISKQIIKTHG